MKISSFTLFKTFFKVGAILLGGGYVILPILTNELVEKRKWITSDELCEFYAISSSLPGVIAVNTAIFTGRKLNGRKGAIIATFAMVLPAFITIISIASILNTLTGFQTTKNIFWGVNIGIITLLFLAVKEMWSKAVINKKSLILFITCLLLSILKISPVYIVLFAIFCGIMIAFNQLQKEKNKE